ncbi:MAG: hydratase [Tissierellia bacterium]|nr:hydratase [Tissierellia bacterium]
MIQLHHGPHLVDSDYNFKPVEKNNENIKYEEKTIAYQTMMEHNIGDDQNLQLKFDSLTSHDITYVGIIQTARASGMKEFPLPYVLTNCHNSLCAVGGTINEDDHNFAFSAAQKYGGIYVPTSQAVIHSYNREMMTRCGGMILGSDSHTRYGALGTMAIGEGGGELVKQLLSQTYDIKRPEVIAILLKGEPKNYVGPHDVALSIIKAVFNEGFVKNKVMEFIGPGIKNLPIEFRNGIDVMTTETTCLSSIWETDEETKKYYDIHGREEDFKEIKIQGPVLYDGIVEVDLSAIEPMIALPFHPSNVYTIKELQENPFDIFDIVEQEGNKLFTNVELDLKSKVQNGKIMVDQGIIVGCSGGTFDNITYAAEMMKGHTIGNGRFDFTIYPESQPTYIELMRQGILTDLMAAGAVIKPAFCGPCFGAGDTPATGELSIRHATRNFPNRDGSKPIEGQLSSVALMDSKSIAATARNQGILTSADEFNDITFERKIFHFDQSIYENAVLNCYGKADSTKDLIMGPNIKDWPEMEPLKDHLLLKIVSYIDDPVTTTDELIPSGETSSYRSNPLRLAEFTLSRKDPEYVQRAKNLVMEKEKGTGQDLEKALDQLKELGLDPKSITIASSIYANKPGDGSAREQAASCQRVLGAGANIAQEYATKRYRSNLINWGMIPFLIKDKSKVDLNEYILVKNVREKLENNDLHFEAININRNINFEMEVDSLTKNERQILLDGCLINFNRNRNNA